jgi:uncharacterized LabA/DUF88 family protein
LAAAGNPPGLTLEETIVHASVNDSKEASPQDAKLRDWLSNWLNRQPSYNVKIRARKPRRRSIRCRTCSAEIAVRPACNEYLTAAAEKGVDAALVTDLISLAWQRAYDVAVLVSGDADYIPAVEYVQSQGLKVVNAAWSNKGFELQAACWATFRLNDQVKGLVR